MGIDISQLSPAAQKQALEKLTELEKRKVLAQQVPEQKPKKYRNQPVERVSGGGSLKFDSKKEAARYDELMLMLQSGQISDLRLQPEFTLIEAFTTPGGERVRAERYKADFSYRKDGAFIVEDVKSPATKTKVYAVKKKQMQDKYGITIREV